MTYLSGKQSPSKENVMNHGKISRAYTLVRQVRDSLANDVHICTLCGVKKYKNREEWQMREALNACMSRLEKVKKMLAPSNHHATQ